MRFARLLLPLLCAALAACDQTEPAAAVDAAPDVESVLIDAAPPDAIVDAAPDRDPSVDAAPDALEPDAAPPPPDRDGDGVPDADDAFPDDPMEWSDRDGDGFGDNRDPFPNDPTEWQDRDFDGIGDNEDTDDDADGIPDDEELAYGEDCALSDPAVADTDGDGVDDGADPYPRDPFPEFMVRRNAQNTIDLFLSERDGTFRAPVPVGRVVEVDGAPSTYGSFSVGDFDGDGIMDFLAQSSPDMAGQRQTWLFVRDDKEDEFVQRAMGPTDARLEGVVGDLDGDFDFDLARFEIVRDGNVASGALRVYLNNGRRDAQCAVGAAPEDGCFFTALPPHDLTPTVGGQWIARGAFQAVDLDPDEGGHVDLTLTTYASGGNAATRVYTLFGRGDGTFGDPQLGFVHNEGRQHAPANTVMFADFDGDGVGDVCLGFDDDGRAGEGWTWFGVGDGTFFPNPISAVDLNPGDAREQAGGETLGRTSSGRTFDFDFDGHMDLIVGYNHTDYGAPGQTRLYRGAGNGTFGPEFSVIGGDSVAAHAFAIPQRRCSQFAVRRE